MITLNDTLRKASKLFLRLSSSFQEKFWDTDVCVSSSRPRQNPEMYHKSFSDDVVELIQGQSGAGHIFDTKQLVTDLQETRQPCSNIGTVDSADEHACSETGIWLSPVPRVWNSWSNVNEKWKHVKVSISETYHHRRSNYLFDTWT